MKKTAFVFLSLIDFKFWKGEDIKVETNLSTPTKFIITATGVETSKSEMPIDFAELIEKTAFELDQTFGWSMVKPKLII